MYTGIITQSHLTNDNRLLTSVFGRSAVPHESMARFWRGAYRRGFADLCRLFTTSDMEDWFTHVATANKELRSQLAHMQLMLATPKEYGLRVAGHSIMQVTAANKQRFASQRQVAYAGEGKIQTVLFRQKTIVEQNAVATDAFLMRLNGASVDPRRPGKGSIASGALWSGVPGRSVADYLRSVAFPPENYDIEADRLAAYIEDQIRIGELTEWTVFIPSSDGEEVQLGGRSFNSIPRTPRIDRSTSDRFIVRSILNPPDEAIDLSDAEFARALHETNEERKLEKKDETDRPSGPSIRAVRGKRPRNGLLLIYPLDPKLAVVGTDRPLIGVVVSFPESETALERVYLENQVSRREKQE